MEVGDPLRVVLFWFLLRDVCGDWVDFSAATELQAVGQTFKLGRKCMATVVPPKPESLHTKDLQCHVTAGVLSLTRVTHCSSARRKNKASRGFRTVSSKGRKGDLRLHQHQLPSIPP